MATRTLNKLIHMRVVLGLTRLTNKQYITAAKAIVVAMTNNPNFPTPSPSLQAVEAAIDAVDKAETAAKTRGVGLAAARDAAKRKLAQLLDHLRDYVQGICDASPTDGVAIAQSAGMKAKKRPGPRLAPHLSVDDGEVSGSVALTAKALGGPATYYWSYSLDGKTWIAVPDTMIAKATIAGLTAGQIYSFRFRALTRKGPVDFSQVVTHMVR